MNIVLVILALILMIYLAGVAFTLVFLLYIDCKTQSMDINLSNTHIIIPSLFWFIYWTEYYYVKKALEEFIESYKSLKDKEDE